MAIPNRLNGVDSATQHEANRKHDDEQGVFVLRLGFQRHIHPQPRHCPLDNPEYDSKERIHAEHPRQPSSAAPGGFVKYIFT